MPNNNYRKACFLKSVCRLGQLPQDVGIEIAFAGRSNAGKSSVLNVISDNAKLARVSKMPGCTRQINIFTLSASRRLADLPGYGYANVPLAVRAHWGQILNRYFRERQALSGLVLVMDIRRPMQFGDDQMLTWCRRAELKTHIVLNKADKLSRRARLSRLRKIQGNINDDFISVQLFSALKKTGVEEARALLDRWFEFD